jgi:hypothetical protein
MANIMALGGIARGGAAASAAENGASKRNGVASKMAIEKKSKASIENISQRE